MIRNSSIAIILFLLFHIFGCNKGLSPISGEQKAGFSGTITFVGNWPEGITRTHIVVFQHELKSSTDFNIINLKFVSLEIPYGVKTYNFSSTDSSYIPIGAGTYEYVAVAQSKTPDLSLNRSDWSVAGVYYGNNDTTKPGILEIPENTLVRNINIVCNFNNPPPQPPGGN
ncbi:MAG: hypothetical protein WAM24_07715 [Ignavibacteriaceae bacterium]